MQLLDGVVDVYVPDFKYSNEPCGRKLSGAPNYPKAARQSIRAMCAQGVAVIVRILVLPGHFDCCHAPTLDFLASLQAERLLVSVRGQYCPDWKITAKDGELARRPTVAEIDQVRQRAFDLGLEVV